MTKKGNKVLAFALAASLAMGTVGATIGTVGVPPRVASAITTSSSVTYPFTKGTNAFRYSPSFTGVTENGDHWEFIQVKFDNETVDLSGATYIALQLHMITGGASFTIGVHQNGTRYMTNAVGTNCYFVSESGAIEELAVQGGADLYIGAGKKGALLIPVTALGWQDNNVGNLTIADSFYLTHNTQWFKNWKMSIGSLGYYTGEPDATSVNIIADCSSAERGASKYYVDSSNPDMMKFPSQESVPDPVAPTIASYPFRTGENALANGGDWIGPETGDSQAQGAPTNWQTLSVSFDSATVDLSDATYLAVQLYIAGGAPGITYGLQKGDARYSTGATAANGKPVWSMIEGQTTTAKAANVTYGAVSAGGIAGKRAMLLIPMDSMDWQFGSAANKTLASVEKLILTTNSQYNYAFDISVGEIGYYTGTAENMGELHKILTLDTAKTGIFTATCENTDNAGKVMPVIEIIRQQGDVSFDYRGDKATEASYTDVSREQTGEDGEGNPTYTYTYTTVGGGIWTGGSFGKREVTTDSYGDNAIKLTTLGSSPYGDAYTAFDVNAAAHFENWANQKGVSLWARNDSDTEISFNIEVDCNAAKSGGGRVSDRFNIKQGHRFYLYDVNTGKTTVYMTRPGVTLPVGFEGWVRVPFSAFSRATWSNNGVTPEMFMSTGSYVSYLAITVHAATYTNKSFSVNKFGAYATTPIFESALVSANHNTIPELMQLASIANQEEN